MKSSQNEWKHLYNSKEWKDLRGQSLFDSPRCVMCLSMNKQTSAKEVDHIIPHCGNSDLFFDPDNHQSLCKNCHSRKTYYESIKTNLLPKNIKVYSRDIILLFGPPCSGKTTWANKQKAKVIDFDRIKQDVSGCNPYEMDGKYMSTCLAVRNKMISEAKGKTIVIGSLANKNTRLDWINKLNAKQVMMITPMHECIKRLRASGRPNINGQIALIRKWFADFKPIGTEDFI